jgi:Lon protease-like protein
MTRHALEGDRRVAMALLRPGWEKSYYARPVIEPVVCVGTILTHERLDDGKYNFLLQGTARARVVKEVGNEPYRLARLQRLPEVEGEEQVLAEFRQRMVESFAYGPLSESVAGRQFGRLLKTPLSTPDLADLIAFSLLDAVDLKQSLLADVDVRRRVERTLDALDAVLPVPSAEPAARPAHVSASVRAFRKPGMN